MAPKKVTLDRESRSRRLSMIKERYQALVVQTQDDVDFDGDDVFIEDEEFDLILD